MRSDGRQAGDLREIRITPNFLSHPAGSCLIEMGKTRVLCCVSREESVPHFLKGSGTGWLSAEYSMLPGSTSSRFRRERDKVSGRTQEIQRLIGRSLRNCLDFKKLGEQSLMVDCDVIEADGGTRTAAITGGYVALALALRNLENTYSGISDALKVAVAALSVGLVDGQPRMDLHYDDDKVADVDMNVVKTSEGQYVEVQGTGEAAPFSRDQLEELLALADRGLESLFAAQRRVLEV